MSDLMTKDIKKRITDNITNNIVDWLFFTVLFGLIPMIVECIARAMANTSIDFYMFSSEIFFFNVVLTAESLKVLGELKDIEESKLLKKFLKFTSVVVLVFVSIFYGIFLTNSVKEDFQFNLNWTITVTVFSTFLCFVLSGLIQILGGIENA